MARNKIDKEDRAVYSVTHSIGLMTYYALYDKFGFGKQKLRNFYKAVSQIKLDWSDDVITTNELLTYCNKKHIDVYQVVKAIPSSKKLQLIDKRYMTPMALRFVEAGMLAELMMICSVLKERNKFTIQEMKDYLYWIDYYIDSYTRKQPKTNITYLNDRMILDTFIDEMQLDLDSGKDVA